MSPKPKASYVQEFSSEKRKPTAEKIPVASICIPMGSKKLMASSSKQEVSMKCSITSSLKKTLEMSKHVPFRTKKVQQSSTSNTGMTSAAVAQKVHSKLGPQTMRSNQKSESKLFAERSLNTAATGANNSNQKYALRSGQKNGLTNSHSKFNYHRLSGQKSQG